MAIVNSTAIGTARKSAGELVYQHYYGRTIARRKPLQGIQTAATEQQVVCRNLFSFSVYVANQAKRYMDIGFIRSTYGTRYSNFMSVNHYAIKEMYSQWSTKYAISMWDYLVLLQKAKVKYRAHEFEQMFYTSYGEIGETIVTIGENPNTTELNAGVQCNLTKAYNKVELYIYYCTYGNMLGSIAHEVVTQDENFVATFSVATDEYRGTTMYAMGICVADGVPVNGVYAVAGTV